MLETGDCNVLLEMQEDGGFRLIPKSMITIESKNDLDLMTGHNMTQFLTHASTFSNTLSSSID